MHVQVAAGVVVVVVVVAVVVVVVVVVVVIVRVIVEANDCGRIGTAIVVLVFVGGTNSISKNGS